MGSQEHNMVVLGQIVKHIPGKLIEKLKGKYKIGGSAKRRLTKNMKSGKIRKMAKFATQ